MRIGAGFIYFLFFLACNSPDSEYKVINRDVAYKYHQFGDGSQPNLGDFIEIYLTITDTLGDTLHYVPNYPYFINLEGNSIDSVWYTRNVGDSISFKFNRKKVNELYKFYKVLESDEGSVLFHARLNGVYDSSEVTQVEQELLSFRELEEQKELNRLMQDLTSKYHVDTLDGAYRVITERVEESLDSVIYGSEVSIHYLGRFLNGYIFDNTYEKGITPTFTFGKEYQLIDGMKLGIYKLKVGEKAKIILPSRRAFGEEGSLAGIVPPYTTVIFEIEIIKIIN